jgi:MFS family permease
VTAVAELRGVLREPHFPRLYATRLVSQTADGIFQASLASAVFFSPERQTDPKQAAAGFLVLLLPYSLVGPFAGVFLDRWRRQRVLVRANIVRASLVLLVAALLVAGRGSGVGFYAAALAAVSVNRFYLAALSASLPHVVSEAELVVANSLSTTSGTVVTLVGGGIGLGIRALAGGSDPGAAVVAVAAAGVYVWSSLVAAKMHRDLLGPNQRVSAVALRHELAVIARGLVEGARHVAQRPRAASALSAIGMHRFFYGVSTISILLLYRNYFTDDGFFRAGLPGLAQVLTAGGLGVLTAATLTPPIADRVGKQHTITGMLLVAALVEGILGPPFTMPALVTAAYVLGTVAQGVKICVDTIVQEDVADEFRGRVFSFYDTLFNLSFLAAAVVAAFTLPRNGKSYIVVVLIALGYAVTAAGYALAVRGRPDPGETDTRKVRAEALPG